MPQILVEEITAERWSHFRAHAQRVRALEKMSNTVHPSVWPLIEHQCQGAPLLPNLRRIRLDLHTSQPGEALRFLSPSITHLRVSFRHGSMDSSTYVGEPEAAIARALFRLILQKLPNLATLTLSSDFSALHLSESGAELNDLMLPLLAHMPSLRVLVAFISHISETNSALKDTFCELRTLEVQGSSGDLSRFFSRVELAKLDTLRVYITESPDIHAVCHVFQAIHSAMVKDVRDIYLCITPESGLGQPPIHLREIIASLLTLENINHFHVVNIHYIPHVSDDDILALARAWPKLESLAIWHELRSSPAVFQNPGITSLVNLASLCPSLRYVNLPFIDVTSVPNKHALAFTGHAALRFLDLGSFVGAANTVNLFDLAIVLDLLFPNLELQVGALESNVSELASRLLDLEDRCLDPWQLVRMMLSAIQLRRGCRP